jgi:hypothetical protein
VLLAALPAVTMVRVGLVVGVVTVAGASVSADSCVFG